MPAIIKYILTSALRDRLYLGIVSSLILSFSLSIFFGSTFLIENQQTALIYIGYSSRIIMIIGMILFVCLSLNRAFLNKEIEFILTKAISRQQFILAYLAGFLIATILLLLPLTFLIIALSSISKTNIIIWIFSLFCEIWIIISFAILASLILQNAFLSIISTLAFYLISRLIGFFVLAINSSQNISQIQSGLTLKILQIITTFFPRLDLFAQSKWLIYDIENFFVVKIIFLQSLIYIALMTAMSFYDLNKKSF